YGWPYCYVEDGQNVADNSEQWNDPVDCKEVPLPTATFEPRSAPLGLRYFDETFHSSLADSFLVALHGSFDASVGAGYEIYRVTREGKKELFMDGFLQNSERIARPVDFLRVGDNSYFFTDDHGGRIFYLKAE
ncbi:MAG: glucose/sorbosone dehydrogenase, partial [Candidatus Paceibacterota bacterium]